MALKRWCTITIGCMCRQDDEFDAKLTGVGVEQAKSLHAALPKTVLHSIQLVTTPASVVCAHAHFAVRTEAKQGQ